MSTQTLRFKKNLLIDLEKHLERYVKTLPVFSFNTRRYDLNLIKSYLIPYIYVIKKIELTVIKKIISHLSNWGMYSF